MPLPMLKSLEYLHIIEELLPAFVCEVPQFFFLHTWFQFTLLLFIVEYYHSRGLKIIYATVVSSLQIEWVRFYTNNMEPHILIPRVAIYGNPRYEDV